MIARHRPSAVSHHENATDIDQSVAGSGPQHIGALLPKVLVRYGIVLPTQPCAISSARLRRRMTVTPQQTVMATRRKMEQSRSSGASLTAKTNPSSKPRRSGKLVQLPLFSNKAG